MSTYCKYKFRFRCYAAPLRVILLGEEMARTLSLLKGEDHERV